MADLSQTLAFAFPGAGVPLCGAERELAGLFAPSFEPLLEIASRRAGVDFSSALADGSVDGLADGVKQLFTYAFGCALSSHLRKAGFRPVAVAGYSFGIYGALYGAGAIRFETGLDLLERAFDLMAEASASLDCGMAVIVGLGVREIEELVAAGRDSSLVLANSNSATCHVLSGPAIALDAAVAAALERDAISAGRLPLAIPYHHPKILAAASAKFARYLEGVEISRASCPVVSSIDRRPLVEPKELSRFAADNLSSPIDWSEVVPALGALGATCVVDCGPGLSLAQNARFIDGAPPHASVKNLRGKLGL